VLIAAHKLKTESRLTEYYRMIQNMIHTSWRKFYCRTF